MTFNLKVADNKDATKWDEIVNNSNQGTIFHTWDWLKISDKHSNFNFVPQSLKQSKKESYSTGTQKIVDQFIKDEINANYISFNLSPQNSDPRPFKWGGYKVEPNYDYIFDLKCGTEALWMNMKKNARGEINRAEKKGVLVEEGNKEELQILYNMLIKRYYDQNKSANISLEYLFEIYDRFRKNIKILSAKYDDKIITGSIQIRFKNEALSWIGTIWEEIKGAAASPEIDYYIMMGAAGNQRLHSYFSQFNPDLRIRFDVRKTTASSNMMELAYLNTFKPLNERILAWRYNHGKI